MAGSARGIWMYRRARPVRAFWLLLSRVRPAGLGMGLLGKLTQTKTELLKINHYKAPRDKMICILNCCKVIFGKLGAAS